MAATKSKTKKPTPYTQRPEDLCGNCHHFEPDMEEGQGEGSCRRNPRQWVGEGWAYPLVNAEERACGEHRRTRGEA